MKKILLLLLLFSAGQAVAQENRSRPFIWGVSAGLESQLLGIESPDTGEPEPSRVTSERASYGGSFGLFGRWHLWRGISVQPALAISSLRSRVLFQPAQVEYFRFADVDLPLHLVFTNTSESRFPLRGSILLGARLGWNFAAQNSQNLILLRERLALDAGLGIEIRLNKWRLQPEFVYSFGLNNLHDIANNEYDWTVGRIVRDRLALRVLFWRE